MELNFTCTFEDFTEGMRTVRLPAKKSPVRNWEPVIAIVVGCFLGLVLMAVAGTMQLRAERAGVVAPFFARFAGSFGTWLILVAVVWAVMVRLVQPEMRKAIRAFALIAILTMAVSGLLSAALENPADPRHTPPPVQAQSTGLAGLLPLAVIVMGFGIGLMVMAKGIRRMSWAAQKHMHLPHTMRFRDDALEIEKPLVHYRYRWEAFVLFRETKNLFVLQPSRLAYWMIPKRACRDGQEVETLRQFLERKVVNAQPQTTGFAVVVPTAAASALPPAQ